MPFKSFRDFDLVTDLQASDLIVGYRAQDKEFQTPLENIASFLSRNIKAAPNVLYVNLSGSDSNNGESEASAFRTIKRAAAKSLWLSRQLSNADRAAEEATGAWGSRSKSVNIFVRSGDYIEDNPIYLPPRCTMWGDSLRSVTIIPKNKFYDIIWINSGCYVWGFTFRQHKDPGYAVAYPIFQFLSGGTSIISPTLLTPYYNNSTRVKTATARATNFYSTYGEIPFNGVSYIPTKREVFGTQNLSNDYGTPNQGDGVITPFQTAFLTRYFQNLNNGFFLEEETDAGYEFWQTQWYRNNVRRPYTLTSPYPQGNSSITRSSNPGIIDDAGGGVLVDGNDVDGPLRSMVMDSFTQFNEGGKGIHIINNGYAQLVSTFTICCTEGVICETGGTCSINTSNCSFGLSGLVATGKSPNPVLFGNLLNDITTLTNQLVIYNLGTNTSPTFYRSRQSFPDDFQPYPGQCFELVDRNYPNLTGTGFLSARNSGVYFTILTASKLFSLPGIPGFVCVIELETNYSFQDDTSFVLSQFTPTVTRINGRGSGTGDADGARAVFYIRSTITTSAHTMEYIGTGTTLLSAVPQKGGITDVTKEVVTDDIGRVFFTATNQFGDFRIGQDLTIVQATGTIEGDTFRRSILQTVTPFTIALAS
jgi:hypothetical protein